jgi:hypothetical protein
MLPANYAPPKFDMFGYQKSKGKGAILHANEISHLIHKVKLTYRTPLKSQGLRYWLKEGQLTLLTSLMILMEME